MISLQNSRTDDLWMIKFLSQFHYCIEAEGGERGWKLTRRGTRLLIPYGPVLGTCQIKETVDRKKEEEEPVDLEAEREKSGRIMSSHFMVGVDLISKASKLSTS